MWKNRTSRTKLPAGKRTRGAREGQQAPLPAISPHDACVVTVATVKPKAAATEERLGGVEVEMMLDSGSSVSLIQKDVLSRAQDVVRIKATKTLRLVTASGDQLPILDHVSAFVQVGELYVRHEFVTESLVAPVILGVDFLHEHALLLDFTKAYVQVRHANVGSKPQSIADFAGSQIRPIYEAARKIEVRACTIAAIEQPGTDVLDECAVPMYQEPISIELPQYPKPSLSSIVQQHQSLFRTLPGVTEAAQHFIPTTGNPVKVPPRRIPAHYRENVEKQIQTMLAQGIRFLHVEYQPTTEKMSKSSKG